MIQCLHCGAEASNGLALCEISQRFAHDCLEYLSTYFRNLSRQRRPGRPNGSIGGVSGGLNEGGSASVVAALGRAENDISTWARVLADDRGVELPEADTEAEMFTALCTMMATLLTTISTLEWAGQFVRDVAKHERILRDITETTIPGWYAGTCRQVTGKTMEGDDVTCDTATFVIPGLTWVRCLGCGTTTAARDHLEVVLEEARDWVARPMRIAEAVVALVDTEQSTIKLHKRISKWAERGPDAGGVRAVRRIDRDGDEVGPKKVRLGDVIDRLRSEGATRLSDAPTDKQPVAS